MIVFLLVVIVIFMVGGFIINGVAFAAALFSREGQRELGQDGCLRALVILAGLVLAFCFIMALKSCG